MNYIYISILLLFFNSLDAQEFKKIYEHGINQSFGTLLKGESTEFEIARSGNFVMMLTNESVKTIDKNGEVIFEYQCVPKSNSDASFVSDLIGG